MGGCSVTGHAASYERLDEPQRAIEFIDQAIPIAEKAASGAEYRSLLSALGECQEKLGNFDSALLGSIVLGSESGTRA